jgi:hypothetical protein
MNPHSQGSLMMLDIASVEVERPGTGVFTAILTEIEVWVRDQERLDGLFIENVLEPRFAGFFERNGYLLYPISSLFPSYYKLKNTL